MNTSVATWLFKPAPGERVPYTTQGYMRSRLQHRMHSIILDEFKKSGISQAELGRRTGKRTEIICRLLGSASNLELNTISDLIFALGGGEPDISIGYPLDKALRNDRRPRWLNPSPEEESGATQTSNTNLVEA